eukprot:3308076-Rhodomonas_salina.1
MQPRRHHSSHLSPRTSDPCLSSFTPSATPLRQLGPPIAVHNSDPEAACALRIHTLRFARPLEAEFPYSTRTAGEQARHHLHAVRQSQSWNSPTKGGGLVLHATRREGPGRGKRMGFVRSDVEVSNRQKEPACPLQKDSVPSR